MGSFARHLNKGVGHLKAKAIQIERFKLVGEMRLKLLFKIVFSKPEEQCEGYKRKYVAT